MNLNFGLAAVAGVFFALWPMCMNRSNLTGFVSSAFFSFACLFFVLPFAVISNGGFSLPSARWWMVFFAGITGALGLLFFNSMLSRVPPRDLGTCFVIMILVQLMTGAVGQAIENGSLPPHRIGGFVLAFAATYLLTR